MTLLDYLNTDKPYSQQQNTKTNEPATHVQARENIPAPSPFYLSQRKESVLVSTLKSVYSQHHCLKRDSCHTMHSHQKLLLSVHSYSCGSFSNSITRGYLKLLL